MANAELTIKLTGDDKSMDVRVTAQSSPGPSGYEVFKYSGADSPSRPEIPPAALRTAATLRAFLRSLLDSGGTQLDVWILEPRLPRLRALLGAPAVGTEWPCDLRQKHG